ncbi:MAG: hypothetical protein ABI168_06180 [Ginsengibacter sp.]
MKKKPFNFRIIFGCFSILVAGYMIVTTRFYDHSLGFNYRALLFFLLIIVIGVGQLFQRNVPLEKRRVKMLFWTIVFTVFVIFLITVVGQQAQIKKLENIEQSKSRSK